MNDLIRNKTKLDILSRLEKHRPAQDSVNYIGHAIILYMSVTDVVKCSTPYSCLFTYATGAI